MKLGLAGGESDGAGTVQDGFTQSSGYRGPRGRISAGGIRTGCNRSGPWSLPVRANRTMPIMASRPVMIATARVTADPGVILAMIVIGLRGLHRMRKRLFRRGSASVCLSFFHRLIVVYSRENCSERNPYIYLFIDYHITIVLREGRLFHPILEI